MGHYECGGCGQRYDHCKCVKKIEEAPMSGPSATFEIRGGRITHRYLMGKSKYELATMYMDLLKCQALAAKDIDDVIQRRTDALKDELHNLAVAVRAETAQWKE